MITKDYVIFFKELESNNNKEWFQEHKKDYENHVKIPFLNLLESLIGEVKKLEPKISINPKDALFRINRDIRFSKDKTPYNTLMKAGFSPDGKKSLLPGYYLGVGSEFIHVGGGLFNVKAPELKKIRQYIKNNQKAFSDIIHSTEFKALFQELKGGKAKRLDKDFQSVLETIPEIANKQFYAMKKLEISDYLNSNNSLEMIIIKYFKQISVLNNYLKNALK